ncbi:C2H2 finger domain-containing protein [Metarhizium album ARSEF 1941]|uniref:C2H2 finger domain-containing protein n=1 Tax=Metarhizium album (strain ARSEF 1941) TaxID=1081103 RepID=A0A0B2WWJ2_METAS|nr:C2H2 finger domain-containing protein [Metarhizium album ARSEF 1941]KHN97767.1 C2H2 finger domain-containing protein [Metarhizium album ARSEF 1941]
MKPVWTKFGERLGSHDAPDSFPYRQATLSPYWNPEVTPIAQQNGPSATGPHHSTTSVGPGITGSLPAAHSPSKAYAAPKQEPGKDATAINTLELAKRVKKSARLPFQSPRHDAAQSRATPPPSSTSTPNSQSRGRPKGWKPGMSYAAMRGNTPPTWRTSARTPRQPRTKAPLPGFGRRPGRPSRMPSPSPKELYHKANPHFVSFICEWAGCKAELHNFDTLRRHLHIVHQQNGKWPCHWAHCGLDACADGEQWRSHLEDAHLLPFRWHVGDGPSNTSGMRAVLPDNSPDQLPDFLMGSDGRQVTPSIRDQQIEDFATWKANRRKLKELLIQRDQNLPDESSESSEETG